MGMEKKSNNFHLGVGGAEELQSGNSILGHPLGLYFQVFKIFHVLVTYIKPIELEMQQRNDFKL